MYQIEPTLPGRSVRVQKDTNQNESHFQSSFPLVRRPSDEQPRLHELLPTASDTPALFEPTNHQQARRFARTTDHINAEHMSGREALAVYAPDGELGEQAVHLGCRTTLLDADQRTSDQIKAFQKEKMWTPFDGNPDRQLFSSWVTTDLESQTKHGHRRTQCRVRIPRIYVHDVSSPGRRPVIERAYIVQSVDWGFVETGAYLTPQPEDGRALELAETVADAATAQAVAHETPEFYEPEIEGQE